MRCAQLSLPLVFSIVLLCCALFFPPRAASAKGAAPQTTEAPRETQPSAKPQRAQASPTRHAQAKPDFATPGGRAVLRLTFNRAMLDDTSDRIGKSLSPEESPFVVTPEIPGEGRWLDAYSFVFQSYDRLPRATTFSITPRGELKSRNGAAYDGQSFSYAPHPFTFSIEQISYARDGVVTLEAVFSCKVDFSKLKAALTVADAAGALLPVEITPLKDETVVTKARIITKPDTFGELTVSLPEGFLSEEGPVGLALQHSSAIVKTTSMLAVKSVRPGQSSSPPWERRIEVRTTNSADIDSVKRYLAISPPTKVDVIARSNGFFIVGDFLSQPRVVVTLKKGMPGLSGILNEDFTSTVVFPDFPPRMAFESKGTVLSPERSMLVPFSAINVDKITATLWQLPESNIPLMAMGAFASYKKHLSRKIAERSGSIEATRNAVSENSIDLTQIAGKAKGVFLLTLYDSDNPKKLHGDEPGQYRYYSDDDGVASPIEKLVIISDIGVIARVMPNSIAVWANSITSAEALSNARVRVFTANNVLLAEGRTDKDGLWRHVRTDAWNGRERPAIVVVSTTAEEPQKAENDLADASTTDVAFLRLNANLSADSAFDVNGRDYAAKGYEAFCFTPRGVFRPGETVDFKTIVRDARLRAPGQFPIAWSVRSSTGRLAGEGSTMLSPEGAASFALPLVPSAPTGRYFLTVGLPGRQNNVLGRCSFSVAEFQPPRIETVLTPAKAYTVGEEPISIALDAKYLFGAPAADAPWESVVSIAPLNFSHPDWRDFFFPGKLPDGRPPVERANGVLDGEGRGELVVKPTKEWRAPALAVTAALRVREDGGRWVSGNVVVTRYAAPVIFGRERAAPEAQAGVPHSMRIAAVSPDGKAADITKATVVIKRIERYYARTNRGYAQSVRYAPVAETSVALDKGVGVVTFTPPRQGEYQIEIDDPQTSASLLTELTVFSGVSGTADGASPLIDRVLLSWERPRHKLGETAALKVRAPFPGKLLIALESDKEIFNMVLPLKETETTVHVPVLPSMVPNAYCSAWIVRPVREGEAWGAHRAYGVIPLLLDRSESRLDVAIDAPTKIAPKTATPVSITLTDSQGLPARGEAAIALVDEGVLAFTNYDTPDPFNFFTAKRAMRSMAFDVYDNLMPFSTHKPLNLHVGGGAFSQAPSGRLSSLTRKLKPLSIFLGVVSTDGEGRGKAVLQIPEYSGKGRLMVVAATKDGVGSASAEMTIARDVTVEATTPRMVAPGDAFAVPLFVFSDGEEKRDVEITVETEGPLAVAGERIFTLSVGASPSKTEMSLPATALDFSGMGVLRVAARIAGSTSALFEQRFEIPVRPPFPLLSQSGSGVVKAGEDADIRIDGGFFPGTQKTKLTFSGTPGVGLLKALEHLESYPYGCLEQVVSTAWPYLTVPAMLRSLDPQKAADTEFTQTVDFAVRRILSMQRSDGGFNAWPGADARLSPWGSVYAAHFLTEAKKNVSVPEDALNAALAWMRSYLSAPFSEKKIAVMDPLSVKAYVCYVLALNGDAPLGWMRFLEDQGELLPQSSRILLAGAHAEATGKTDALRELGTRPFAPSARYGWSLESASRNEALRLLMWASADAFAPEAALLAERVLKDGAADHWRSTQENAMAVTALGRYIEKTSGPENDFMVTLRAILENDGAERDVASFTNKDAPVFSRNDLLPAPPADPAPLRASVRGKGAAYYAWNTSGIPMKAPAPFSEGLSLLRRWTLPDGTTHDFIQNADGTTPEALRNLKVPHGAKITATLFVKPESAMNSLVLTDIIPGGFEIDNPNPAPDARGAVAPENASPSDPPEGFKKPASLNACGGRIEARDDRLLLFVDAMPSKASVFTYTLRAVTKGTFILPPLAAEDMYDPSVRALSPAAKITVE